MAFEKNDLKGILILVLFAVPMIASTNINCSGRAFHCVNSTHFMICVDLGGGLSTTIDDFVIPCPATTVCHENNIFECDFPEVLTPPPLQVIGVYKQSDTSEPTTVTNSVTPASDIFSVVKENVIATTLPIPKDETPVVKLEVLEGIKDPAGVNNDNTTETSLKVTPSFIDSGNEILNDKQASNKTIITSVTDNNKNLEQVVETSIHKTVNTSLTDNSKSIDTVTHVIGLINLISTDSPSVASKKTFSGALTPLDSLYDNIATTTEQYISKEVTMHGDKVNHVTDKLKMPTEIIFTESSVIPDAVSTTPVVNTYNKNNTTEYVNKIGTTNQNIAEKNNFSKSHSTSELVPETTIASVQIDNILEPVTVVTSPKTMKDNTLVPLGLVDLISGDSKLSLPSTNGYINTFYSNAATTTTDQYTTKLKTTLSEKPVTAVVISTNPIINAVVQNVSKNEVNNNAFIELNSTGEITTIKQTTIEKTFIPITTEANIVNTTETVEKYKDLFAETKSIVTQPLDIVIDTESPIADNLYQINKEINLTLITTKNITVDTINTTEKDSTVFNVSSIEIIYEKSTEPTLPSPTATKYPAIEITTTKTVRNTFSASALEVPTESPVVNISSSVNEPYLENVKNDTLLYKTTDLNTTGKDKTVLNNSSTHIISSKHTEPTLSTSTTIKYPTVATSIAETSQNDFTTQAIEAANEIPVTNAPPSVNEPNLENIGANAILSVLITPATYYVTADPITNSTDLTSQSDIATDPMNLPVNLGTILYQENLNTEKAVQDVVGQMTTYRSTVEKSVSTYVPSHVTENTNLSHIVKHFNQDNISATDVVKTQDVLKPKATLTVSYVPKFAITTHKTVQTKSISVDSTLKLEQVSTYTPEIDDVYKASTSGNKIETSAIFPVDVTHTTNAEYVTDIPITTQPPHESTRQIISTVKQLNTANLPSDLVSTTFETAGYDVHNTTYLNTSNWKNSVNIDTVSSKNADANETKTVNTKESSATLSVINNEDESIKIVSVLDIVNSSRKVMSTGTMQQSSPNPSLSNGYIKTTASQDSGAYVTATDNVPDYTLVQVGELVSQKNPEATMPLAETIIINSVSSTLTTLPIIEISTEKVKYVGTEAPIPSKIDFKYTDLTKTAVDYVTEKTNYYVSTDAMISQLNKLPVVLAKTSSSSVKSVTTGTVVTPVPSIIVPDYDEVTTLKDSAFITSSTVTSDSNIKTTTESPLLTSIVIEPEIVKFDKESSLLTSEVLVAQMITEPTHTDKVFSLTTRWAVTGETNQDVLTEINTTDLPQSVLPTINNNKYQSMPPLPTVGVTTAQITTEPTHTAKVVAQTATVAAVSKTNQDVLTGIKSTKPQNVSSTVSSNITLPTSTIPIARVTAEQIITTEPIHTINTFAHTMPLASTSKTNQNVLPGIETTDLPQYVISTVNNNTPVSMPSVPAVRVTVAHITTEPAHTTNTLTKTASLPATGETNQNVLNGIKTTDVPQYETTVKNKEHSPQPMPSLAIAEVTTEPTLTIVFAQTTPPLASARKTKQDVPSGIKTTYLPQYVTSTVTSNNPQFISYITTETITDSLTAPDSMVETINVTGAKINGTYLRETISSDVTSNNPTVNNFNNSVKTVISIIDHESIVIGTASKTVKPVDMTKAEIVNHTESNWIGSDVNIDSVKIKDSGKEDEEEKEEEDSKSLVTKSGTDVQNLTLASDSSLIPKIEPKDGTPVHKIEYRLTTITTNHSGSESGAPNNETQLKPIITKENKKAEVDSLVNANIEIIDVSKHQVLVDSKNISESYNKYNTNSNITTSLHNLSQQNSTINDELEQHLISTNHTITTELQSHLNESDKQSNKSSDELPLNVAIMHNPIITSIKLNASSNAITVPASVFNCTNHTRGKYADKKDCRKFYTCIGNLQPLLGTCPNNTVFSEINKQCTRNLSHCVRNNQFRCLFEGRFSDFFIDNIYYICVKNRLHGFIRYKLQCQADYRLNKDSVKCEKKEEISTQSVSSVSETNTDESKSKPKSEKIVSTGDFECEKEGKFPYAKDCSKYYVCTKVKNVYRRKIKKCAIDEVFDENKKKCVESDSGEC